MLVTICVRALSCVMFTQSENIRQFAARYVLHDRVCFIVCTRESFLVNFASLCAATYITITIMLLLCVTDVHRMLRCSYSIA